MPAATASVGVASQTPGENLRSGIARSDDGVGSPSLSPWRRHLWSSCGGLSRCGWLKGEVGFMGGGGMCSVHGGGGGSALLIRGMLSSGSFSSSGWPPLRDVRGGGEVSVFDVLRRCCRLLLLGMVPRFAHLVMVVDVTPRGGALLVSVEHCPSVPSATSVLAMPPW
ncbi:hypothetical protein VPH35_014820 [Triticum aestivum]